MGIIVIIVKLLLFIYDNYYLLIDYDWSASIFDYFR